MYPLIPHHLTKPSPDAITSSPVKTLFGLSNKNVKSSPIRAASTTLTVKQQTESATKITAITDIPRGICSEDINIAELTEDKTSLFQNVSTCYNQ